jgi:hypothetical protein
VDADGCSLFRSSGVGGVDWSPTTDARDAERVWDWLADVGVATYVGRNGGLYKDAVSIGPSPAIDITSTVYETNWKRALCEAALAVARKGKA